MRVEPTRLGALVMVNFMPVALPDVCLGLVVYFMGDGEGKEGGEEESGKMHASGW